MDCNRILTFFKSIKFLNIDNKNTFHISKKMFEETQTIPNVVKIWLYRPKYNR